MNHFNLKSLIFYGTAIGSVLVLFKVVTFYGETRLSASPPIAGTYRLQASESSPCLPKKEAKLSIEQSGIYLRGTLIGEGLTIHLDGRFQGEKFTLTSPPNLAKTCSESIQIKGNTREKTLTGFLISNPNSSPIALTFEKEKIEEKLESH